MVRDLILLSQVNGRCVPEPPTLLSTGDKTDGLGPKPDTAGISQWDVLRAGDPNVMPGRDLCNDRYIVEQRWWDPIILCTVCVTYQCPLYFAPLSRGSCAAGTITTTLYHCALVLWFVVSVTHHPKACDEGE